MTKIILYTTHCPKCNVLTKKMRSKNIKFSEISDVSKMTKLGITTVPVLNVDGKLLDFKEANDYINSLEGEH